MPDSENKPLPSHGPTEESWFRACGLLGLVVIYSAHAFSFWHYLNDDAYITFRYAARLASGLGPYFNEGEHVEGYTNLLLMLWSSVVITLLGPAAAAPAAKILGVMAGAGCVAMVFFLTRFLWPRGKPGADLVGLSASGLLAVLPSFALNSVSGLETTLFALFVISGVYLGIRADRLSSHLGSAISFGLGGLTRPEGFLIFAVFWLSRALVQAFIHRWVDGHEGVPREGWQRGALVEAVVVTAVFAAQLAFRLIAYDGEWLPNTYFAKIGGFAGVSPWAYVRGGTVLPLFGAAGVILAGLGLTRISLPGRIAPVLIVAGFGAAEPFWAATDWMLGWLIVVPYLPLLATCATLGWSLLLSAFRPLHRLGPVLVLLALPLHWLRNDEERQLYLHDTLVRAEGYETGHRALGWWLASDGTVRGRQTVALMDIGMVGFLAPGIRVLDITGLTDQFIGKSPGPFMNKTFDVGYVFDQKPRRIVVVLTGRGASYEPPAPGEAFKPFTSIEHAIVGHPEFRRWYARPRPVGRARWPQDLAASIGAERVFEHAYPRGLHYLLAVFSRQAQPSDVRQGTSQVSERHDSSASLRGEPTVSD